MDDSGLESWIPSSGVPSIRALRLLCIGPLNLRHQNNLLTKKNKSLQEGRRVVRRVMSSEMGTKHLGWYRTIRNALTVNQNNQGEAPNNPRASCGHCQDYVR